MSAGKTFQISLNQEPAAVVGRAKQAAAKNGIDFQGNEQAGQFLGKGIAGSYTIDGARLQITVSKKPMILPWGVIESSIVSFFD